MWEGKFKLELKINFLHDNMIVWIDVCMKWVTTWECRNALGCELTYRSQTCICKHVRIL